MAEGTDVVQRCNFGDPGKEGVPTHTPDISMKGEMRNFVRLFLALCRVRYFALRREEGIPIPGLHTGPPRQIKKDKSCLGLA